MSQDHPNKDAQKEEIHSISNGSASSEGSASTIENSSPEATVEEIQVNLITIAAEESHHARVGKKRKADNRGTNDPRGRINFDDVRNLVIVMGLVLVELILLWYLTGTWKMLAFAGLLVTSIVWVFIYNTTVGKKGKTSHRRTIILKHLKNAEAILIPVIVIVFISVGLILLWFIAGGVLAFAGLLASSIVTLSTLIGIFWTMFLKKVVHFLLNRHSERERLFWGASRFACVLAILTIMWAFIWQFDPYYHIAWPVLNSSLSSSDNFWHSEKNITNSASCLPEKGAFYVTAVPSFLHTCFASSAVFDNFIYQVQMKFVQGECGGIDFRADPVTGRHYYFEICRHRIYGFVRYDSLKISQSLLPRQSGNLTSILSSDIKVNQPITLAVVARGSNFEFWIDHHKLDIGIDLSAQELKEGEIGIAADGGPAAPASHQTIIAFSNAEVWQFYGG